MVKPPNGSGFTATGKIFANKGFCSLSPVPLGTDEQRTMPVNQHITGNGDQAYLPRGRGGEVCRRKKREEKSLEIKVDLSLDFLVAYRFTSLNFRLAINCFNRELLVEQVGWLVQSSQRNRYFLWLRLMRSAK